MDFLEEYKKIVKRTARQKGNFKSVAEHARVSESWVSRFSRGQINDPGFFKIFRLKDALNRIEAEGFSKNTICFNKKTRHVSVNSTIKITTNCSDQYCNRVYSAPIRINAQDKRKVT